MAELLPLLRQRFFDDNGDPLAGGKLYSYIAGTSTPLETYTDSTAETANSNPVVMDADGYADVWIGAAVYKFVLADADDNILWTKDNIASSESDSGDATPWARHSLADGQVMTDLDGETIDFDDYSSVVYDVEIIRGTTVFTNGTLSIQDLNGVGRVVIGLQLGLEAHGITFGLSQVATVVQLRASADSGAGASTVKLSRRLVPRSN